MVAVFVLWVWIARAVDNALDYDQPVLAGDGFIIAPDVTMAAPAGWDVQAGVRERDRTRSPAGATPRISVSGDGIVVTTDAGTFAGDARALNAQVASVNKRVSSSGAFSAKGRLETVTLDGHHGVARRFSGVSGEGAIFTFAEGGRGLEIVISQVDCRDEHERHHRAGTSSRTSTGTARATPASTCWRPPSTSRTPSPNRAAGSPTASPTPAEVVRLRSTTKAPR